jgi:predicted O-linked N-acetylglucosamine transferase (SPINDLY family)
MFDSELQNALRLRRAGKLAEAAAVYGEILKSDPSHFEALHSLGLVRYQTGQLNEAERLIGEAVKVRPMAADALFNRASLLARLGRVEESLVSFGRAIAAKPDYIEALTNRGVLLSNIGRFAEALSDFDQVTARWPGFAQGWRNRTSALEALGRLEDALASAEKVTALEPKDASALLKRADLLLQLNRTSEAEPAYGSYLVLQPGDAGAWNRRGIASAELKRKEEALASFDRAVALSPGDADFRINRANALFEGKRFAEAAGDYEKALALAPDLPYAEGYLLQCRLRCCDWNGLAPLRRRVAEGLRAGRRVIDPLSNLADSTLPAEHLQCARIWVADAYPSAQAPLWRGERYRHGKIRVAYLSADFRLHPVAYLIAGVFEHHDPARFEIYGISFTPPGENAMRARIEKACHRFHDVRAMTDQATAELLRALEVDIAVDLMGFTDSGRTGILAKRAAPVQVNWLGYPSTMGAEYIDYILADATVIPEEERRHFSEQVAYLPDTYLPADSLRPISKSRPGRPEAGLPNEGFVFASFNDSYKIAPDMFDVWMRLLKGVDGSVLWLARANPEAVANLKREAAARGVVPERLIFANYVASMEDHLARLGLADLILDTLPYNAHASTSDALWAGVPLVTCKGRAFAGRVAASAVKAARLSDLVTHSLADYEALALKLARDPSLLAAIRMKLGQTRERLPLFDTARFTRHLETAYRTMWERASRGEAPSSFSVTAQS